MTFNLARVVFFFILFAACRLVDGASIVSGEPAARLKVHNPDGVLRLSTNSTHDFFKRQTTTCATIAPLCAGTGNCCSGICCANDCCINGSTCTGGQCVANTPPPASSSSAPQADPSSSSQAQVSSQVQSSSQAAQSSTSGTASAPTPNASSALETNSLSATGSASSTTMSVIPFVDYNVTTVTTDSNGPDVVTFGSFTATSTYIPTNTDSSSSAPSQEPLVVQQVPPTVTNNPEVQMQYNPTDAWETSGSEGSNGNTGSGDGGNDTNGTTVTNRPIPLCNNGTKISNHAGSTIQLTFTGVQASLQMVPSLRGAKYSVQLDDEDPEEHDSFKADANQCSVSIGWTRTNLPNTSHNVTVIVKGNTAGGGGSDSDPSKSLEFNGLQFTGPAPPAPAKGTSKWIIVGVAVGAFVILAILVVLVVLMIKKRRQRQATASPSGGDQRASTMGGASSMGGQRLTHAAGGTPRTSIYTPSHVRNDSSMSSPPGSAPGSPSMRPWGLAYPQTQTQAQPPSMHQRQASWVDGGAPIGTAYIPPSTQPYTPPPTEPYNPSAQPYSIPPPSQPYAIPYNGGGSPRQGFVPGHSRGPSSMSDNRNPFEG